MRRTIPILIVLALVVALAVAACGGSDNSTGSATTQPAASPTVSAQQLVQDSLQATDKVTSASFTADLGMKMQGDAAKMDPATQALAGQGMSLHVSGKAAKSPAAADMTMTVGFAGQTLDFAVKAQDGKAWIQYQDKWYVVDQKTAQGLVTPSASPQAELKGLGLDPAAWGATYTYVGAEDMGGTQVYHVKATVDPKKMADSVVKALNDPAVAKQLSQNSSGKQLAQSLKHNKQSLRQLRRSLKNASADFWMGASDKLMRKVTMTVDMDLSGQTDHNVKGIGKVSLTAGATMADFGQNVTVTPPANALPFSQLMNSLFGGMLGGMGGGSMSF